MNVLHTIGERAAAQNLSFLLAGGHAVITHGFARATFDVDLIVPRNDTQAWMQLAQGLGYVLHHEGPTFVQFDPSATGGFPLDLMTVNEDTFSKLRTEAVPAQSAAPGVWAVSLPHLLALKCHAIKHGHRGRVVKDAEDVIQLILLNGLDPDAEAIRELFLKHGTVELYEKVRKACSGTGGQ